MSINMAERIQLDVPSPIKEVENSGKPFIAYTLDEKNNILHRTQVPAVEIGDTEKFEKALVDSKFPLVALRHGRVGMCSVRVNKDVINLKGIIRVTKRSPVSIMSAVVVKVRPNKLYNEHYCPDSDVGFIHIKGKVRGTKTPFNVIVAREQDIFSGRTILNPEDYTF